jgi:hypothetical protein
VVLAVISRGWLANCSSTLHKASAFCANVCLLSTPLDLKTEAQAASLVPRGAA